MLYLSRFTFPSGDNEWSFFMGQKRTCYDSCYPFGIFPEKGLREMTFEPITILYGGNGSGKTTALNVIAESLGLQRDARFNQSSFFGEYVARCQAELRAPVPPRSRVITSDDVFDYMLNLRALNEGVDEKREELFQEYLDDKYSDFKFRTMADYERLKKVNLSRRKTQSQYVRTRLMDNVREQSNGESAYFYFTGKLEEGGLYLLDEPENSLSPARQMQLAQFLEESARFFSCQLIIATHSPFLLALRGACVWDLDASPVRPRPWTELEAVRTWHDFFEKHRHLFLK